MRKIFGAISVIVLSCCLAVAQGYNAFNQTTLSAPGSSITIPENTVIAYHQLAWTKTGTVSACSATIDSSPDGTTWTTGGILTAQTCTTNGSSATINATANYVRVNAATLSGGGSVTFTYKGYVQNPSGGGGGGSGTVTNIATTAPVTGGPITATGTIACPTCAIGPGASTANHVAEFVGTDGVTLKDGGAAGSGTVTSVGSGTGLTGGPVTGSGTIALTVPVVTANGGTGVVSPSAHSLAITQGASAFSLLTSPTSNGNCVVSFNVVAAAAVDPTCALSGILVNAQSGNYSLAFSDRGSYILYSGGTTATLTLCQITGTCAGNFPFVVQNLNSGNLTITANAADKIDNGSTGGSITLLPNQIAFFYQDSSSAPGNWKTAKFNNTAGAGGSGNVSNNTTNTFTSSGTLDLSAASVTAGLRAPQAAGAAPTILGNIAIDTNTNTIVCGNGTTTRTCTQDFIGGGGANNSVAASTTTFVTLIGRSGVGVENTVDSMLPLAGTVSNFCVRTSSAQSTLGSLVFTLRDSTAAADSTVVATVPANSAAGKFCDTTHSMTVVAGNDYVIKIVNNASATSATIEGTGSVYSH